MSEQTKTTTPAKTSKPRVNRTPAQKAQDRLDDARARLTRAKAAVKTTTDRQNEATKARNAALEEEKAAQAAADFEARNPDLPKAKGGLVTGPIVLPGESGPEATS